MTYDKLKKQAQELVKEDNYTEAIKIYVKLFKENLIKRTFGAWLKCDGA